MTRSKASKIESGKKTQIKAKKIRKTSRVPLRIKSQKRRSRVRPKTLYSLLSPSARTARVQNNGQIGALRVVRS